MLDQNIFLKAIQDAKKTTKETDGSLLEKGRWIGPFLGTTGKKKMGKTKNLMSMLSGKSF